MTDITFTSEIGVEVVQQCGGDQSIGHAARVSTRGSAANDVIPEKELTGLIRYLMQHRHGTPFEHSFVTFNVHAPIFVWREWHRHRIGFSYNEESARYKTLDPVFYLPPRDRPMMKVGGWKPGRPKFQTLDEYFGVKSEFDSNLKALDTRTHERVRADIVYDDVRNNLKGQYAPSYQAYLRNLELGIDPGLARDCLPVGIYSSCWVSCNPRSLMAFLSLRTHDAAAKFVSYPLYEIEQAARKVEAAFAELWPVTYAAFCEFGRVAP